MAVYEVWEYGAGDGPRNMYRAVSEEKAIKAYMGRMLITGNTYRDHLKAQGVDRLLLCVKNPALKGTRANPNYPSVYTLEFADNLAVTLTGHLVDGEFHQFSG